MPTVWRRREAENVGPSSAPYLITDYLRWGTGMCRERSRRGILRSPKIIRHFMPHPSRARGRPKGRSLAQCRYGWWVK